MIVKTELTYVYVTPSYRNMGVGRQLLELCRDKAKAAKLSIHVASEPAGHAFFSKAGFEEKSYYQKELQECSGNG